MTIGLETDKAIFL